MMDKIDHILAKATYGKRAVNFEEGEILLVNKPIEWTSFDVVHRLRTLLKVKKIGHTGTLDPKATGLLILCTGKKTKTIHTFLNDEKEYEGVMELGAVTQSFDSETPVEEIGGLENITNEKIETVFRSFLGQQLQEPPMYSAIKYGGKPLYKFARKGRTVVREPREIHIHSFEILSITLPLIRFRVACSKGTYIRSLINDVGKILGCGAYLKELQRTRIGNYSLESALTIDEIKNISKSMSEKTD